MPARTVGFAFSVYLLAAACLATTDSVTVPWPEFQQLYHENLERTILKAHALAQEPVRPQRHTLEVASYHLAIDRNAARGEVQLAGKILEGDPTPIPLFDPGLIVTETRQMVGGTLLCGTNAEAGIYFLPDGTSGVFQVELSFLVHSREDRDSRAVGFAIPAALQNTLRLELTPDLRLREAPGLADAEGVYHFAPQTPLAVRFVDQESMAAATLIEIDTFSTIRLQAERAILTTTLAPARPFPESFQLRVPDGAQYVSSSLKPSWIRQEAAGTCTIRIPPDEKRPVTIQFALAATGGVDGLIFNLPQIQDNTGREGDFVVEDPEDGQVRVTGTGLTTDIPAARLGAAAAAATTARAYMHLPPGEGVALSVKRFTAVRTPPLVLDTEDFFVAFEENGNVLSVLSLVIPPEFGTRLPFKIVADTEVWSLTVNGRPRKLFANEDGAWVIPLEPGETSRVQLALLSRGEKLGLQGRLEAVLPETGLPARRVRVGIALPARVQLLSLEGPLNPAPGQTWDAPAEFVGTPHYFSRAFYGGQEMHLAVAYKEPVKAAAN